MGIPRRERTRGRVAVGAGARLRVGLTDVFTAAQGGLLVLQWARAHGCQWGPATCGSSRWGRHLDVLRWAREDGCLWNKATCALRCSGRAPRGAAVGAGA